MDILFLGILVIFIVFTLIGYKRGFFKSVLRIVLTIVTMVVAYVFAPLLSDIIVETTNIDEYIEVQINNRVKIEIEKQAKDRLAQAGINISDIDISDIPEYSDLTKVELTKSEQVDIIQDINMPDFVKNILLENNSKEIMNKIGANNFYEYISKYISHMIIRSLSFFALIIVMSILSLIIYIAVGAIVKMPILKSADKIAGALLGAGEAIIIIWLVLTAMQWVSSFTSENNIDENNSNIIVEKLYESNMFENALNSIIRFE